MKAVMELSLASYSSKNLTRQLWYVLTQLALQAAYPEGGGREDSAKPVHSNAIVDICCIDSRHSKPGRQFSTAGWDGQVVLWSL